MNACVLAVDLGPRAMGFVPHRGAGVCTLCLIIDISLTYSYVSLSLS